MSDYGAGGSGRRRAATASSSGPLTVVHVIDRLGVGGAEALVVQAAQQARHQQWDLSVVSLGDAPQSAIPDKLEALGIRIVQLPSARRRTLFDLHRLVRLRKALIAARPDVVHTHLTYANTLTPIALIGSGIPIVATLHNASGGVRRGQSMRDRLEAWTLRHLIRTRIAVGPTVARTQSRRLARPVLTVPNPVAEIAPASVESVTATRSELLAGAAGPLLLAVGRLSEQKGFDDLIAAFERLHGDWPEAVLAIVGRGHLREQLQEQAQGLGLAGAVRFTGVRDDVALLMQAADLVVSSSRWEGLPLTVLEAMAAGRAIVATDVGDVGYATGTTARLVPAGDRTALADAMGAVLADDEERKRREEAALERVRDRHSVIGWAAALDRLYERLSGRRPASLAVLTHGYAPRLGGIERQRAQVTPRLAADGLDITVITRGARGAPRREVLNGVHVVRTASIGGKAPGSAAIRKQIWRLARPFDSVAYSAAAFTTLVRHRPDVIHTHEFISTARIGLLAGRILGRPVIVTSHRSGPVGDVARNVNTRRGRRLLARISSQAALAIGVSQEIDGEIEGIGVPDARRFVITNGVDTERYRPVDSDERAARRAGLDLDPDAVVVIFTGRLMPEKRVDSLLRLWPSVRAAQPRAVLVIAGTGDDEAALHAMAPEGVRFTGVVADTATYLQASDVFVLPSVAEGLSNALLEAQACGLATVITDVGAAREVVTDGLDGLIVAPDDLDALRIALIETVTRPDLRASLGQAARKNAVTCHSIDATVGKLLAVYQRLWDERSR